MKTSENGLNLIKQFEGCRLVAYKCPAGVWTIGTGHTSGVKPGMTITQVQADEYLRKDVERFEKSVNVYVSKLNLNQNQFDALVSFTFNGGEGMLQTLCKNRNTTQIANALLLYNKGGGKVLQGLVRRRKAEQELFNKPVTQNTVKKVRITATALNIRAGMGVSYKVIGTLKKGSIVSLLDTLNGWGKISNGYISLRYTEEI